MTETPTFKEEYISQISALQLLLNMGYRSAVAGLQTVRRRDPSGRGLETGPSHKQ